MNNRQALKTKLTTAFATSMDLSSVAADIAFHMTDWDHNLDDLIRLYEQPEAFSDEEVVDMVIHFLAHVPNHVAAAKKLVGIGPIEDVFQVGVLREDE